MNRNNRVYNAMMFNKILMGGEKPSVEANKINHEPKFKSKELEGPIQSVILDYLLLMQAQGKLFAHRINNVGIWDEKIKAYRSLPKGTHEGVADILVIIKGQSIFVEVKAPMKNQTPKQIEFEAMALEAGAKYYLVRSFEFAKKIIDELLPSLG